MDKQEVSRLFHAYKDDVYRLALSYLCSRQDAEDICQTVFLQLLETDVTLFPGKEKAWLLTCTANRCKSQLRSLRRHRQEPLDEAFVISREEDRQVLAAVMALPPKYRIPIHLFYFEGYSQEQIAGILNLTRTNVQTRMARARAMLRKELTEYDESLFPPDGRSDTL